MSIRVLIALSLAALVAQGCSQSDQADETADGTLLLAGQCRDDDDCLSEQSEYCATPGAGPGCGACYSGNCYTDEECVTAYGAGYICGPINEPCACGDGGECAPGCAETGCGPEADCGADGRCVVRACTVDDDCGDAALRCANGSCKVPGCLVDDDCDPPNSLCNMASYACYRVSCTTDGECAGFCVLGQCWDEPGHCQLPAA